VTAGATAKLAIDGGTPVRAEFLPIARPMLGETEKRLVLETLESGWITTGERSLELGQRVATLAGARHGLAVNSATGALHLALVALGVKPGDEVITSPYTFAACVNVIEHVGATPVLADVEADTLCIDPRAIEAAITPRARILLPVDYAGHPCAMDAIVQLARDRGLRVVEDAAHALGARWRGKPIGSFADVTAFSFYATKNLTTGEGGAAVTDDEALAERMSVLSLHGMSHDAWKRYGDAGSWFYEVVAPGFKYNLSDVLAAIGLGQLERFDEMQRSRTSRKCDRPPRVKARITPGTCSRSLSSSSGCAATGRNSPAPCAPRTSAARCISFPSTSTPTTAPPCRTARARSRWPRTPTGARSRCRSSLR
jgi:dTDP-4-amino-4,6-dideoxygalactose transaminase